MSSRNSSNPTPAALGGYEFEVVELGDPVYYSPPPAVKARGGLIPAGDGEGLPMRPELGKAAFPTNRRRKNRRENIRNTNTRQDRQVDLDAKERLESRIIEKYSARPEVQAAIGFRDDLKATEASFQSLNLTLLDKWLTIVNGYIGRREVRELSLAYLDFWNTSPLAKDVDYPIPVSFLLQTIKVIEYVQSCLPGEINPKVRQSLERTLGSHILEIRQRM